MDMKFGGRTRRTDTDGTNRSNRRAGKGRKCGIVEGNTIGPHGIDARTRNIDVAGWDRGSTRGVIQHGRTESQVVDGHLYLETG